MVQVGVGSRRPRPGRWRDASRAQDQQVTAWTQGACYNVMPGDNCIQLGGADNNNIIIVVYIKCFGPIIVM